MGAVKTHHKTMKALRKELEVYKKQTSELQRLAFKQAIDLSDARKGYTHNSHIIGFTSRTHVNPFELELERFPISMEILTRQTLNRLFDDMRKNPESYGIELHTVRHPNGIVDYIEARIKIVR